MGIEMIEAGWLSVLPPLIAITLALLTKEVYSSLLLGIFSGTLIYCAHTDRSLVMAAECSFDMIASKLADNSYMLVFLALLGSLVTVVSRAGGSEAYGRWAGEKLKKPLGARLAVAVLGLLIFIDDGFNCLTVGTVMRPVTDKFKISREKLAYLLDATAAPVCIIAPISSWAVAVASELEEAGGFYAFLQTIPYNLYALLTLIMVFTLCLTNLDFGPMKKAEGSGTEPESRTAGEKRQMGAEADLAAAERRAGKDRIADLALPLAVLIVCAVLGMAYVGGFFEGVSFSEAIGANPTAGLTLGAFAALLTAAALYLPRKVMTLKEFMSGAVEGVRTLIPAMLILIFSWALSGVCREMIGTGLFVSEFVRFARLPMQFLPALIFVTASFMSFSMGTAWGTFGILIPIVSMICSGETGAFFLIPALGATLAGSVFGDHCSPISDTTILASMGAQCEHIRHVETQIPYALLVAGVCFAGYLAAGFAGNPWLPLALSVVLLLGILGIIAKKQSKNNLQR